MNIGEKACDDGSRSSDNKNKNDSAYNYTGALNQTLLISFFAWPSCGYLIKGISRGLNG